MLASKLGALSIGSSGPGAAGSGVIGLSVAVVSAELTLLSDRKLLRVGTAPGRSLRGSVSEQGDTSPTVIAPSKLHTLLLLIIRINSSLLSKNLFLVTLSTFHHTAD